MKITDSSFHHSQCNGFYMQDQTSLEISNSTISYTNYPALFLDNSKCIVRNCEINHVNESAIDIENESIGIIEETTFSEIVKNSIVSFLSELKTKNNRILSSKMPAIGVSEKSKAEICGDKISNAQLNCIVLRGASEVKINGCEIENVAQSGISISDTEKVTIMNCKIKNCEHSAVEAYNDSTVEITGNEICQMKKHAFLAFTSGHMKANNNTISDVEGAMVKLIYKGGGDFFDNKISNCSIQCECKTSSPYFFCNNGNFLCFTNDTSRVNESVSLVESSEVDNSLCLMCNKNQRDSYLIKCGHNVYCIDCAKKAQEKHENCPLCRFPIDGVQKRFDSNELCIICMDNRPNCIVLPCGHICACSDCLDNWFKNNKVCPVCRTTDCFYKKI